MKWAFLSLLLVSTLRAETSKLVPIFLEASQLYFSGDEIFIFRPEIKAALRVLKASGIEPRILLERTKDKGQTWELREDDSFDLWTLEEEIEPWQEIPEVAVHAYKLSVIEESDDWLNDDIYAYFFITDGVIPTGKVTSIYKGLDEGESFFFNQVDRSIFPLTGVFAKKPHHHLIIDYGIIESDGDDVKELQKLSTLIIDLALAVYSSYEPQTARVLLNLRKEVKALSEMLLSLNHDDRLATGTIGFRAEEIASLLKDQTYVELSRNHHGKGEFNHWEYVLYFRLIKN